MNADSTALVLATGRSDVDDLRRAVERLREDHGHVLLAAIGQPPERMARAGADEVHDLAAAAQAHGPAFRRSLHGVKPPERLRLHVERDDWVAGRLGRTSTVMAADPAARSAVDHLATRNGHLRALDPSATEMRLPRTDVAGRSHDEIDRPSGPVRGLRRLRDRLRQRTSALAGEEHQSVQRSVPELLRAGDVAAAEALAREGTRTASSSRQRADSLGDVTSWSLAHGRPTGLALQTYAAELAVADDHLRSGDLEGAVQSWTEAMRTAFHPVLHFDSPSSPLAEDPAGFTAPLRTSVVAERLSGRAESSSRRQVRPTQIRTGRRLRLLIATQHNADFLAEIRQHFEQHEDFETRFHMFQEAEAVTSFVKRPEALVRALLARSPALTESLEQTFREHLSWADVVFVEWSTGLAALLSHMDTKDTRVVVRLHSYEAFTQWPQLTNFSRVDDVIFVSDHLRDLAARAVPGLQGPGAPRLHVVPNAMQLRRFVRPKPDEARFALAVVGATKRVKDPRWAIEVVRRLRQQDDRYRLHLLRAKFQVPNEAARGYADALERDLDELEPTGAVVRLKHTDDVPSALESMGVVVSSSLRESFHMGLVEGAASGALPVVRDWPFFPGAARELFPEDWVVGTPEEAADRILRLTADAEVWRRATAEASRHVLERWDWSVVRRDFERLLRGD